MTGHQTLPYISVYPAKISSIYFFVSVRVLTRTHHFNLICLLTVRILKEAVSVYNSLGYEENIKNK